MPRFEFFPNLFMTLINVRFLGHKTRPVQAVFRIAPRMNKLEVKEYLQTIYGLPVKKVMTDNFYGGYRRIQGKRAMFHVSRPNYKRAVVTFERGAVVYPRLKLVLAVVDSFPRAARGLLRRRRRVLQTGPRLVGVLRRF